MANIKVSVIVPVYKGCEVITQSVDSMLRQT